VGAETSSQAAPTNNRSRINALQKTNGASALRFSKIRTIRTNKIVRGARALNEIVHVRVEVFSILGDTAKDRQGGSLSFSIFSLSARLPPSILAHSTPAGRPTGHPTQLEADSKGPITSHPFSTQNAAAAAALLRTHQLFYSAHRNSKLSNTPRVYN